MLHDIIITIKNGELLLESCTPKGEEFIQLYSTDLTMCPPLGQARKTAVSFKWMAEELGLKVTLNE